MTAGSGIIHQEMPKGDADGRMHGFQLWANLPVVAQDDGAALPGGEGRRTCPWSPTTTAPQVRIVCGSYRGTRGPVDDIAAKPVYLDVSVPAGKRKTLPVETTSHAFAYVFAGTGKFCNASEPLAVPTEGVGWADTKPPAHADNRSLVLFDRGDEVEVQAGDDGHPVPPRLRQAARGAGGLVRPDRHEHAGGAPARVRAAPGRDVPQARRSPLAPSPLSRELGEFPWILYLATDTRESIGLQLKHHERARGDVEGEPNVERITGDEAEARVVLRMADDDYQAMPQMARFCETALDQR